MALEPMIKLDSLEVGLELIVSDDDSTMRSHLKYVETDKHANLPVSIPQPKFLRDPSHRIKMMVKDVFGLATEEKNSDLASTKFSNARY